MLKQMLFVGAAALSFPALAQSDPAAAESATTPPVSSEVAQAPIERPATDPVTQPVQPAPDAATAEPAPADNATRVAQIVDREFAAYDADSTGELNDAEFATWMKRLRAATDPSTDSESPELKQWIGQAFAAADRDSSKSVSKSELTDFLSKGA